MADLPTGAISIKGGYVILRDYAPRKLAKAYNAALYENVSANANAKGDSTLNISVMNMENAKETLVLGMIEKAMIKNKEVEVNQTFIDEMDATDFAKLAVKAREVAFGKEEEKKSS